MRRSQFEICQLLPAAANPAVREDTDMRTKHLDPHEHSSALDKSALKALKQRRAGGILSSGTDWAQA